MPTYAQLEQEAAWRAEFVPPALAGLGVAVRNAFGLPANAIGFKGDNRHLNGGHRSRRWIRDSRHCTNRSYTVSYPDDKLGDENWLTAFDVSAPPAILLPMCQRLDAAVRAGKLEELSEWYGNLGGDDRVDGYNNIIDRLASSDSSHLTHLHGTVLRRYANDAAFMARLAAVLIGDDNDVGDLDYGTQWKKPELVGNRPAALRLDEVWTNEQFGVGPYGGKSYRTKQLDLLVAAAGASEAREKAALAAITALADNGGVEAAPIIAAVERVGDELGAEIGRLKSELAAMETRAEAAERRENELLAKAHADAADQPG